MSARPDLTTEDLIGKALEAVTRLEDGHACAEAMTSEAVRPSDEAITTWDAAADLMESAAYDEQNAAERARQAVHVSRHLWAASLLRSWQKEFRDRATQIRDRSVSRPGETP